MKLLLQPSNRWCGVKPPLESAGEARRELLLGANVEGRFALAGTPAEPINQTAFSVHGDEDEILVTAAMFDSATPFLATEEKPRDDLEIFFDMYHDHAGFFQFQFTAAPEPNLFHLLPYPESHSTVFPYTILRHHEFDTTFLKGQLDRIHWLFARFASKSIFRKGRACGFNLGRYRPWLREASSWNFCAGIGFPDATSFGHLYLGQAPVVLRGAGGELQDGKLRLRGTVEPAAPLGLELIAPNGDRVPLAVSVSGTEWQAEAVVNPDLGGRYRLYPRLDAEHVEPNFLFFNLAPAPPARRHVLSMTYDMPDNFTGNTAYTPELLDDELRLLAGWGINRIYWMDYGPDSPFWKVPAWRQNATLFFSRHGDILPLALKRAKAAGMEFYGIFKVFDMGTNRTRDDAPERYGARDADNRTFYVDTEVGHHQEWTMQTHPAWVRETHFPVRDIVLYSERPLPALDETAFRIWVSGDNKAYAPYDAGFSIQQGVIQRPHHRWTPAGKIPEAGTVQNWFVKLSGLTVDTPFVALEMCTSSVSVVNHRFTLAEAADASGQEPPITVSLDGDALQGFLFGKEAAGWGNASEVILGKVNWKEGFLGLMFRQARNLPTVLEPSFEGTRSIWLSRLKRILDAGADGVDVRILCHHNGCPEWLKFAFAEPVRLAFLQRHGREVEPVEADYESVRRIRGEFFTQFLREARALTRKHGKKLAVHIETRIDVPPCYDSTMQIFWDWPTWLNEGLMDEITLKYWTCHSTFVHENILPLARKKGIPVHVESQIVDPRGDVRALEKIERVIRDNRLAGMDGTILYEAWTFLMPNPTGTPTRRGLAEALVRKAAEMSREG